MPVQAPASTYSAQQEVFHPSSTGQETFQPVLPVKIYLKLSLPLQASVTCPWWGAYRCPPEPDTLDFDPPHSYTEYSDDQPEFDEGEISSDTLEKPELTEDMNYRETVRSIRSFIGWNHIPPFESDLSEPDKSNNPWKGKTPKRLACISVAMPPDDWLCQKLEKFNTVVAEGWTDGTHRPGKSLFSWQNTEAKVNSQFPRIIKASAYPSMGPPSRPMSQEYLRRWEKCAKENSYTVNDAMGFNRCTSELQERMNGHISIFVPI